MLPTPLPQFFDYLPCEHAGSLMPGARIKVPFGTRELIGVLLEIAGSSCIDQAKLKPAIAVLDKEPIFDADLLSLCQWVSDYYQHPMGEVVQAALPKYLRAGKSTPQSLPELNVTTPEMALTLNNEQKTALDKVNAQTEFGVFLLAGVTGSGKTEVYLQAIDKVLARGNQALVLVPEISLTPQTLSRFEKRFGGGIVVLHSGMTEKKRVVAWLQAKSGAASIVIGTRSAVFAPLQNLGIIIIDEEHDLSFKSQSQLRYSARDVAIRRAQQQKIPIILGSATPSLESYYNVVKKRYQLLTLTQRAGYSSMPKVRIIDLRKQVLQAGLSRDLLEAIQNQLTNNKQVLVFINRRGFAPVLLCHQCGHVMDCQRCDAKLTLHKSPQRLLCHHCDRVYPILQACPKCKTADLITVGQGTEKIEEALMSIYPDYKVVRIDKDTASTKNKLEQKLALAASCEADILVGTQMLAKGHHFPNLGLSAILDVDGGFYSTEFRAIEHLAQLIVQVAGRAGREVESGEVIIQTHEPNHPHLQLLLQKGYAALAKQLLKERQQANLPPFSYQAVFRAEAQKAKLPQEFLQNLISSKPKDVIVLGPIPAPIFRKAGRYCYHLLLQSNSRHALKAVVMDLRKKIASSKLTRQVRWSVDIDPVG